MRNTEMLRQIADLIEAEPHRYDQSDWIRVVPTEYVGRVMRYDYEEDKWIEGSGDVHPMNFEDFAYVLLDIDRGDQNATGWLDPENDPDGIFPSKLEAWANDNVMPTCETACCIAGHATFLGGWRYNWRHMRWVTPDGALLADDRLLFEPLAREILGLEQGEAEILFDGAWRPKSHLTVPQALRALADGDSIGSVTYGI